MIKRILFAARFHPVQFIGGIVLVLYSTYALKQPAIESEHFSSAVSIFGTPMYWAGLIAGFGMLLYSLFNSETHS